MCEHCGCRGVEPIADLMDEHLELLELAGDVRRHLARRDREDVVSRAHAEHPHTHPHPTLEGAAL